MTSPRIQKSEEKPKQNENPEGCRKVIFIKFIAYFKQFSLLHNDIHKITSSLRIRKNLFISLDLPVSYYKDKKILALVRFELE